MLTVHTIPEERLTCGLQAPITIRSTQHPENVLCHGEIDEVCSPHSCRIRIRGPLSTDHKALLEGILSAGEAILQPEKRRAVLNFESLSSQLQRPTLAAQNAADIPAQALARATTLFAAMKVAAVMLTDAKPVATHGRNSNDDNRAVWREAIEQEVSFLRKLQRGRPRTKREEERQARAFTALQTNGWVDQLIDNLFLVQSHAHFRENAAVVSVMGGLAAEEVVKALTGLHSPVQQFFCFEALRALPHGFLYGDSSVPFRAASKASATALR